MGGGTKSGVANNTSNVPVRFGDLYIEGEGAPYADSAFANKVVKSGTTVTVNGESATVSDSTEQLIVDGVVFADYYYAPPTDCGTALPPRRRWATACTDTPPTTPTGCFPTAMCTASTLRLRSSKTTITPRSA